MVAQEVGCAMFPILEGTYEQRNQTHVQASDVGLCFNAGAQCLKFGVLRMPELESGSIAHLEGFAGTPFARMYTT